jgi:glycosyltransferase involved in cell wall biosynthesis
LNWWRFRWRPDLLHIQGYTSNLLFVIEWAYAKNLPVVYEEHQTPDAQFDWWQGFGHTINKATTVVAVSEKSAQALRDVCGVTRPIVVRNPLLPDPVAPGWQRNGKAGESDDSLCVTTVARLYVTKGLTYLLDAIVQVKARYPNTYFRIYGDGPLYHELLAYAAQLGLNGEQIFAGAFNHRELDSIMAQTDVFALSSILEGQPLAVVEAMAYSCPIVATAVGGIPELIQDGVNGLLCEAGDPACLAAKICALIENRALRQMLGQAARKSFERGPYQPASVCDHFISVYQEVLQSSGPKPAS